jgi:hypothetical protein
VMNAPEVACPGPRLDAREHAHMQGTPIVGMYGRYAGPLRGIRVPAEPSLASFPSSRCVVTALADMADRGVLQAIPEAGLRPSTCQQRPNMLVLCFAPLFRSLNGSEDGWRASVLATYKEDSHVRPCNTHGAPWCPARLA